MVHCQTAPRHINNLFFSNYNRDASENPTTSKGVRHYGSDLVVILDMDECLVHSQSLQSPRAPQVYAHQQQLFQKRRSSSSAGRTARADFFQFTLPEGERFHVRVRPGLYDFLQKVCSKYETHIFTAALQKYADPLLDHIDPHQSLFAGRWYRDSCEFDRERRINIKNLANLPILPQLDRAVLVDNNPLSFLANPNNGILVSSFLGDPSDNDLEKVWMLLEDLNGEQDVRLKLREMFHLENELQPHYLQRSVA